MDTTQFLLSIILTISTLILVVVGIQLIFILKELRKTIKKVRESLDEDLHSATNETKNVHIKKRLHEKRHATVHTILEKIKFFNLPKTI